MPFFLPQTCPWNIRPVSFILGSQPGLNGEYSSLFIVELMRLGSL